MRLSEAINKKMVLNLENDIKIKLITKYNNKNIKKEEQKIF